MLTRYEPLPKLSSVMEVRRHRTIAAIARRSHTVSDDDRLQVRCERKMAQNIYDDPEFFAGYSRLDRSVRGLDGAPEWPAIRALLPDLSGKRVLDLGCGFGWFVRWARQQGASSVVGLDLSERMLARAKADSDDPHITYVRSDFEYVDLSEASYDFVYSSLALHYVQDFALLMKTVHRALVPDAFFVFTIEHPIYMAPAHSGWWVDQRGRKSWPVNGYSIEGPRTTDWFTTGVVKQHRTIGTTLNTLIDAGFAIRRVQEFAPTREQIAGNANLAEEMERPMMLIVSAQR
jgi:ubiquinone/menaquinone biosynthesis C-methylase UbiE